MTLKENHPQACQKYKEWLKNEFPNTVGEEVLDSVIDLTITYNPWLLLKFFDENEIYITMLIDSEDGVHFTPMISIGKNSRTEYVDEDKTSRLEALNSAIRIAFKNLEDKLKKD